MAIKATQLRQNLYQLLDGVIQTGKPLEIEKNGKILRIVPRETTSKFDHLEEHDCIVGNPDDLFGPDWSSYWSVTYTKVKAKKKKIAAKSKKISKA